MRIVSLVPSITETICQLGFGESIVGCTNFCMHPIKQLKGVMRVGGTKDPDIENIRSLKPTHILLNKEENRKEDFEKLRNIAACLVTDIRFVHEVPTLYKQLGEFIGAESIGIRYSNELSILISQIQHQFSESNFPCIYFIWKNPWMCVSRDTYIADMLGLLGFNVVSLPSQKNAAEISRYPELQISDSEIIIQNNPQLVTFFSSEPYPFRKRDLKEYKETFRSARDTKHYKVDGKLFSWYGASTFEILDQMKNGLFESSITKPF